MSKRWASTLAGLGLLAFGAPALAGNIVTNGDFGTGDLTGWTTFETPHGTPGIGFPVVASFDTTGTGDANAAEFNVGAADDAHLGVQRGGGIAQVVDVTGGAYVFNAAIASLDDANGLVNGDAGTFTLLVDGQAAGAVTLGGFASPGQVLRGSLSDIVSLGAGAHTIGIQITRLYDSFADATPTEYVTGISLTASASAVPEPGIAVLAFVGLTALGAKRIRRARRG